MQARDIDEDVPPSMTAMQVAQAYYSSVQFNQLEDNDSKKLIHYLVAWAKHAYPFKSKWVSQVFENLPVPIVKGLHSFFKCRNYPGFIAQRKTYISEAVDNAIQDGIEQVVVIGGGFDVMALVKHKQYPHVQFYELDRGPHQQMKQQALEDLRHQHFTHRDIKRLATGLKDYAILNDNIHYIAADLSDPAWRTILIDHGFSANKRSICIGEGLTAYLAPEETTSLLGILQQLLSEESRLILSFIEPSENTAADKISHKVRSTTNEGYKTQLTKDEVPHFMLNNGFQVLECLSAEAIQSSLGLTDATMKYSKGLVENYFISRPATLNQTIHPIYFRTL